MLAGDHQVVRQALHALLAVDASLLVVGEAAEGMAAVELVAKLAPDVLLVGLMTPGLGGLEVVRRVKRLKLATRVVVLAVASDSAHAVATLESGANGYLDKDAAAADLLRAIHEVAAGRRYLSPALSGEQLQDYSQRGATTGADLYSRLTARERQVLELAAHGLRNREIAERLGISPRTAESHRAKVMSKLELRREADLVRFALRQGIVLLDPESVVGG